MLSSRIFNGALKKWSRKPGRLVVISSPTAGGKTTVCAELIKSDRTSVRSVSCTTRKPRKGEKNGVDYFFVSEKTFKENIKRGVFLEWAKVHDSYYGTPAKPAGTQLRKGKNVILTIDVKGGSLVKRNFRDACLIFLLPPSFKEMLRRIKRRGTERREAVNLRLKTAEKELGEIAGYQYLVINDTVKNAVGTIRAIIKAENSKLKRVKEEI